MVYILNIETATTNCSVSLSKEGETLVLKEDYNNNYSHAERLHIYIDDVLKQAKVTLKDLDAISISKGPGSYTGLRIGVSAAKGLCFSLEKPLISIATLEALAHQVNIEDGIIVAMLDARRMEVYSAVYDAGLHEKRTTSAVIIDEHSFSDILKRTEVLFFGDGADKCKPVLGKHKNARFDSDYQISATSMVSLSAEKFEKKLFEDVAYFEPYYLKEFIAGKPKKLIP